MPSLSAWVHHEQVSVFPFVSLACTLSSLQHAPLRPPYPLELMTTPWRPKAWPLCPFGVHPCALLASLSTPWTREQSSFVLQQCALDDLSLLLERISAPWSLEWPLNFPSCSNNAPSLFSCRLLACTNDHDTLLIGLYSQLHVMAFWIWSIKLLLVIDRRFCEANPCCYDCASTCWKMCS